MQKEPYWRLWFDDSDESAAMSERHDLKSVDEYVMYEETALMPDWPRDPEAIPVFWVLGRHYEDYLVTTANAWELFSAKVRNAFRQLNVSGAEFLPVRVVDAASGSELDGYSVLHVWRVISALDKVHADWVEDRRRPGEVLSVYDPALLADVVNGLDIFRLDCDASSVYMSDRLTKAIKSASATGFKFREVPVY